MPGWSAPHGCGTGRAGPRASSPPRLHDSTTASGISSSSPSSSSSSATVEQLFFFASHGEAAPSDLKLLRHYSVQLSSGRYAAWLLLYRPEAEGMQLLKAESQAAGAPVLA